MRVEWRTGKSMARISLIEEKDHPELRALIAKIHGERGGRLLSGAFPLRSYYA